MYVPGDALGDAEELSGISLKGIGKAVKKAAKQTVNVVKKVAPVASFIPGVSVIAAPVALATKAAKVAKVAKTVAPKKKAAPVVRVAETTAAKAKPASRIAPVKTSASVVRAADSTATKAARKPLVKPPAPKTATAAEQAEKAKKVVSLGERIRRAATSVAEKVRGTKQKADQLATKADALAKAGDIVGAKKFSEQAAMIAESARNAGAQIEQNIAPAIETAGAAAQGATEGAVARVGFESIPKPVLFGAAGLLLIGGAWVLTRKKGKAA